MFPCVFFKLSNGTLGNNTLLVASLDLAIQGFLVLCRRSPLSGCCTQASPPGLLHFLGPLPPLPLAHAVTVGGAQRSPFWGGTSVCPLLSLHGESPPCTLFQGGPMGPAATLANPPSLENKHLHQGAWAPGTTSLPQQIPLCALPSCFCTPLSRGPVAGGKNPPTPREKAAGQRPHPKEVGKKENLLRVCPVPWKGCQNSPSAHGLPSSATASASCRS